MNTRGSLLVKAFALLISTLASAAGVSAAPILPMFEGHVFDFGAWNSDMTAEYQTNGSDADMIRFTPNPMSDREVTTYRETGPDGIPVPIFSTHGFFNFGGDFVLDLALDGEDATPGGEFDVSLTGSNMANNHNQLIISGVLGFGFSGELWILDIDTVSLYGNSDSNIFVLEAEGEILASLIPTAAGIVGERGAVRGFLELDTALFTPHYDPMAGADNTTAEATYSGQTGLLPEPGTLGFLLCGLVGLLIRRKRADTRPA